MGDEDRRYVITGSRIDFGLADSYHRCEWKLEPVITSMGSRVEGRMDGQRRYVVVSRGTCQPLYDVGNDTSLKKQHALKEHHSHFSSKKLYLSLLPWLTATFYIRVQYCVWNQFNWVWDSIHVGFELYFLVNGMSRPLFSTSNANLNFLSQSKRDSWLLLLSVQDEKNDKRISHWRGDGLKSTPGSGILFNISRLEY